MRVNELSAIGAPATGADAGDQDAAARRKRRDERADRFGDADALMAENAPRFAVRDVAFQNVRIGAANGGPGHSDDRVRGRETLRLGTIFQAFCPGPR